MQSAFAQNNILKWTSYYDYTVNQAISRNDQAQKIITDDVNPLITYVVGLTNIGNGDVAVHVRKYDQFGNLMASVSGPQFGAPSPNGGQVKKLLWGNDGNLYVFYNQDDSILPQSAKIVFKFNKSLNLIKQLYLNANMTDAVKISSNDFISVSNNYNGINYLVYARINSNLNLVYNFWWDYDNNNLTKYDESPAQMVYSNGYIYVAGTIRNTLNNRTARFVQKFDTNMTSSNPIIWTYVSSFATKKRSYSTLSVIGNFVYCAGKDADSVSFIAKHNLSTGAVVNSRTLKTAGAQNEYVKILNDNTGGVKVVGYSRNNSLSFYKVNTLKYSADLVTQNYNQSYTLSYNSKIADVINGSYFPGSSYITGYTTLGGRRKLMILTHNAPNYSIDTLFAANSEGLAITTNYDPSFSLERPVSCGYYNPVTSIFLSADNQFVARGYYGTINRMAATNIDNFGVRTYPNPSAQYLNFEFENPLNESVRIFITNALGVLVLGPIGVSRSNVPDPINIATLSAGTYFYSIQANNLNLRGSFVKQ